MAPITQDDVFLLLEPMVGIPLLLCHSELAQEITALLLAYDWRGTSELGELRDQIESLLFNSIYSYTQGTMVVKDAEGNAKKVYTDALSQMAETLLEPVFIRIPVNEPNYELINGYALRHHSLPALKQLYTRFKAYLQPMNHAIFRRIITENYPKEIYEDWMVDM